MDDREFRLQRHLKVWEEQSKSIKRFIIAGLLFSILLPIKVLNPFVLISEESGPIEREIIGLVQEQNRASELNKSLVQVQHALKQVQETIKAQPWMEEKEKLINTLSDMRERSPQGGSWPEYQEAADKTIRNIHAQVNEMVIQPLERALLQGLETREELSELSRGLDNLRVEMDTWERDHVGQRWYETFFMKDKEMRDLTYSLHDKLNGISRLTRMELSDVQSKQQELAQDIERYDETIKDRERELDGLNEEMQKLLPEWLQGLISIEQMTQLFPLVIAGLIIYITLTALTLAGHYEHAVSSMGVSEKYKRAPLPSSVWTLTYRGLRGTVLTTATYIIIALALWFFFEWGTNLLERWLVANRDAGWIGSIGGAFTVRWIGRALFAAALCVYVLAPPYRKWSQSDINHKDLFNTA